MTLTQILADIYRRTGFASSPPSEVSTRITAFVNETQQEILREGGMQYLLNESITLTSVADQQTYGLAVSADKIKTIRDQTNTIYLEPMSLEEYRMRYPDPSANTGLSTRWVDLGFDAVSVEPSDASTIYVDSTSASDTGTAYIEGVLSSGQPFSTSVTMTGTTAVAFTPTTIINITKFYLSTAAVGSVTLNEDAEGGTTLATIRAGASHSRYRRIALVPTPSSAVTYVIDYERNVADMANGTDEPVLPEKFHYLLSIGARMKEYEKTDNIARWTLAKSEFDAGIRKFKFWLYQQSVGSPNLRGFAFTRPTLSDGGTLAQASGSSSPHTAAEGGTGFSSYTIGDMLTADTATSLSKLTAVATGRILKSQGVGVLPAWDHAVEIVASTSTGTQNAWNPGHTGDTMIEWAGASAATINGITGGVTGVRLTIVNTGSSVISFTHQSGSGAAGELLFNAVTSGVTPVASGGWISYVYDGSNWLMIDHEQGAWITPTFDAADFTAVTAGTWTVASGDVNTMAYRLVGNTLTVAFSLVTTTVARSGGDPTDLQIDNDQWGDFTATKAMYVAGFALDNSAGSGMHAFVSAGGTVIRIRRNDVGQWANATDTTAILGTITFEVT